MNVLRARSPPPPARVHTRLLSAALPPRHLGLAPCNAVFVARRPATRCHDTTDSTHESKDFELNDSIQFMI